MITPTDPAPEATPKAKRTTLRSILLEQLRAGEQDNTLLIAAVKAVFPDETDKHILTSVAVHKSFLKKEAAKEAAAKLV